MKNFVSCKFLNRATRLFPAQQTNCCSTWLATR